MKAYLINELLGLGMVILPSPILVMKKWSTTTMTASAEDDYHPKEKGRCDFKLAFNNSVIESM